MERWTHDDYETPIESYLGYLGLYFDGSFSAETPLQSLSDFDFWKYGELIDDHGGERRLSIPIGSRTVEITVYADDGIVGVLDQLPTVKVLIDNGPGDWGPASGPIYVFFIADDVNETDLKESIDRLALALQSDFASLEAGVS